MFKDYMLKLFKNKKTTEDESNSNSNKNNKKRKTENLICFIIILIITIIIINSILKQDNNINNKNSEQLEFNNTSILAETMKYSENEEDELESKLKKILSKIQGVGEVDVLITYSESTKTLPMYNEDNKISQTEEADERWWYEKNK